MGKQRSKILRSRARELCEIYPDKFNQDYEHNKKELNELDIFPSKISRNIIAGYLVKLTAPKEL
ncbi:MAG: 30S ribosomal protein S17e [Candidatus Micrarchaeota archaeon]